MLKNKIKKFSKLRYPTDENEYRRTIMTHLEKIRRMYEHYAVPLVPYFNAIFYQVSEGRSYLIPTFYSNPDFEEPFAFNIEDNNFHKSDGQSTAARAWRELQPVIASTPSDIHHTLRANKEKCKSIMAYPIFSGGSEDKHVIGVISIEADCDNFFMEGDIETHKSYIKEFALRIEFEYWRWRALQRLTSSSSDLAN